MEWIRKLIASKNLRISLSVIAIKVLVVFFGIQTYLVATDKPINNLYRILYIWKKWDAVHYINIAQNGYTAVGEDRFLLVFYPLYPLLVAILNFIVRDTVLSAFLISAIASIVLAIVFRELIRLDYADRVADAAVLFLFIFPTSFVLHIPYTEGLFLALVVSSFLAARRRRWLLAGVLGGLACATRINGLVLFPALLMEVWYEYRDTKEKNWQWLYLLLIPVGVSSYLGLNYSVSGDPFKFLEYQRDHWHRYLRLPWYGLMDAFRNMIGRTPAQALMVGFQELTFVGIGFVGIIAGLRKLRASYNVWMITNWVLFVSTSYVLSVTRYTIILFPLFILIALLAVRNRLFSVIATVWSILFLAFFVSEFVRGHWTF